MIPMMSTRPWVPRKWKKRRTFVYVRSRLDASAPTHDSREDLRVDCATAQSFVENWTPYLYFICGV
ncbi:hypothetical protein BE221DRAFT_74018 [Ostreococcus tauri]|uniref:Uncharacterized protein n=1 Tax=Ostreococcus tauri TaxID=70448 RepID=A0A1Y5IAI5_OSTTA|nr:hypothetical protein BE221DRAFT_74018 [Ostreococcus tauri]